MMNQTTATVNISPIVSQAAPALAQRRSNGRREQNAAAKALPEPTTTLLTAMEQGEFEECETILENGLGTFFEVGNALLRIRENRLYRATHSTFEQYCHDRWNMGRSYAWRVIGAAERVKLLPRDNNLPRPSNEFQMRPFLRLAPETFPAAWKRAVRTSKEGRVTPTVAQNVIHELLPNGQQSVGVGNPPKRRKSKGKLPLGQVLVLLNETKRNVEKGETEKALAALERIESLLCAV